MPAPSVGIVLDNATAERLARIEARQEELVSDIGELRAYLASIFAELKKRDEEQQKELTARVLASAEHSARIDQVVKDMGMLEREMAETKKRVKAIEDLMPALRLVIWIGAALGISVLALIWALITGQAQVVFL